VFSPFSTWSPYYNNFIAAGSEPPIAARFEKRLILSGYEKGLIAAGL
jgi:hypothetical protein